MTSEQLYLRSDLLGTQIITRDTGKRLGVVSQIWVDVDRREVVALGIRENVLSGVLSGMQQMMLLSDVRQIGDVILVEDDSVVEDDLNVEPYSVLIGSEVITETGELLGKVRGFRFNPADGRVESLIIASVGLPFIPEGVVSTYELSIEEVVSSGPDRLIVFEGAEQKLRQMSVGLLERVGIGRPPWERDDDEEYIMPVAPSNQLPSGVRTPAPPIRTPAPAVRETWDEDNWEEPAVRRQPEPLRQQRPLEPEYLDDEDNWSREQPKKYAQMEPEYEEEDLWGAKDQPEPYRPPQVNIPERKKAVEYEEDPDY